MQVLGLIRISKEQNLIEISFRNIECKIMGMGLHFSSAVREFYSFNYYGIILVCVRGILGRHLIWLL